MKRILITGAGGFIGGRVTEVLKETQNPEIHILLRNISKGVRISRYPLHYVKGSITEADAVRNAMQGCEAVVHCAHDFANPQANILAAEIIADQCLENGVQKLVYISSFAVHQCHATKRIDEQTALNVHWDYAANKLAVEKIFMDYFFRKKLPVVILRPSVVYGPFSTAWTIYTIQQMLNGRKIIPNEGEGICNAVYIDDVAGAVLAALRAPAACHGQSYIVSGPEAITWREFYQSHLSAAGPLHPPVYWSRQESAAWYARMQMKTSENRLASWKKDPVSYLKNTPVYTLYRTLLRMPALREKLLSAKKKIPAPLIYPSLSEYETLTCNGYTEISKLKTGLGYQPQISFSEGMRKTLLWIAWANLHLHI